MHNRTITRAGLFSLSLALMPFTAVADDTASPGAFLMEQVRLGEASNRDDLVRQSLARLELIDPDNPEVIAARLRLALRQGDQAQAKLLLDKLHSVAPDSPQYRLAQMNLALTQPDTRQKLEQARLLATAGHYAEAKQAYDDLFHGEPPTLDLSAEYWRLTARLPGQEPAAIRALQAIDKQSPGNVNVRIVLARLLFSQNRTEEGYALLEKVAADPAGRDAAASLWMEIIKRMDVTPQSVAQLNRYLEVFKDDASAAGAQQERDRQQKMLTDPAYQARLSGMARIEKGEGDSTTIAELDKALAASPNDSELIGSLGLAYLRSGDRARALTQFQLAQKADINNENQGKWDALIKSTRYWMEVDAGDRALQAKQLPQAEQHFQQARQTDGTDPYAIIGLGDVAAAQNNDEGAKRLYQQALQLAPTNDSAIRRLAGLYSRQSPQAALAYINSLPPEQRRSLQPTLTSLKRDITAQQADEFAAQGQWQQAADAYRQSYQPNTDDIWLPYHYAQALRQLGQNAQADEIMQRAAAITPASAERTYAYALYLSSTGRDDRALAQLRTFPDAQWNDNMRELAQRLATQHALDNAQAQFDAGNDSAAIAILQQQPKDTRITLMMADWAQQRGNTTQALQLYREVLAKDAQNQDARLGEVEALIAAGALDEARQRLQTLPPSAAPTLNERRRVANAWYAVGNLPQASQALQAAKVDAQKAPPGQTKAWIYRDAARLEAKQGQPQQAQADYRQAMAASGIASATPQDNAGYTRLTRAQSSDDWLQRSIRSDAADLYRQQDINVTLGHDYWRSSGTNGISNLKAHDTMLQVDFPFYQGRGFLRTDTLDVNAGRFATGSTGAYRKVFGTCATLDCYSGRTQQTSGTSVAMGWADDRWSADIGTTPIGFEVVDVVGGVSYSGDWRQLGWTATASRRPISSSLLAFGGAKDPITGTTWGGVRATGVSLGLSYDRGEANGVWSDFSAHQITGKNVADNHRLRAMGGYYYKLINEDHRRVTVGASTMWWSYQKDLSGYSLGQGGYYSPQQYVSFGLPVNYRQRTENWSWELGGTVSWSYAKTKNQRRYPLSNLVSSIGLTDEERDKIETGSSSNGFGYTLRALLERRISTHWTVGAAIDIQEAKDYTPSHGLIYLRYSAAGWQGDLDTPPRPPTPYSDFK